MASASALGNFEDGYLGMGVVGKGILGRIEVKVPPGNGGEEPGYSSDNFDEEEVGEIDGHGEPCEADRLEKN